MALNYASPVQTATNTIQTVNKTGDTVWITPEAAAQSGITSSAPPVQPTTPVATQNYSDYYTDFNQGSTAVSPTNSSTLQAGTVESPVLPEANAPKILDQYSQSLMASLEASRKALDEANQRNLDWIKEQKATAEQNRNTLLGKEEGILNEAKPYTEPFREDIENSERQRLDVEKNFQENQKLTDELGGLLTDIQTQLTYFKEGSGLAAIRDPRIAKATEDATARVGVIEAVMAARNNQISVAENMIDRTVNAIAADRTDKLNYFNTLLDFYDKQVTFEGNKIVQLSTDEKNAIDDQIKLLEADNSRLQANADYIKNLMVNPETASAMARAGVNLNMTPGEVNAALAKDAVNQEAIDLSNSMQKDGYKPLTAAQAALKSPDSYEVKTDTAGNKTYWLKPTQEWSAPYMLGGDYVQKNTKTGEIRTAVNVPAGGSGGSTSVLSTEDKRRLYTVGFNDSAIETLIDNVKTYGLDATLNNSDLTAAQKKEVKSIMANLTVTQIQAEETPAERIEKQKSEIQGYVGIGLTKQEAMNDWATKNELELKTIPKILKDEWDKAFPEEKKPGFNLWDWMFPNK